MSSNILSDCIQALLLTKDVRSVLEIMCLDLLDYKLGHHVTCRSVSRNGGIHKNGYIPR